MKQRQAVKYKLAYSCNTMIVTARDNSIHNTILNDRVLNDGTYDTEKICPC